MATLRELWHAVVPSARPVGSTDDARWDASVAWVRVLRPRVPAFDALEPDEVVIVPASALAVVAPGPAELATLVEALDGASVAGILVVEAEASGVRHDLGGRLAEAAAEAGLASLVTDRRDPSALERSLIGYLVNRRAELERQAADLERQLERLALAGRGLDAFAAAIGAFLDRAVAIERRRGDALAIHAPAGLASGAAAVAQYHARPSAVSLRVPLPAGADIDRTSPVGSLVILGDELVGERDRIACDRIAPLLALELARGGRGARAATAARADTLPSAGPPWVVYVARQGALGPEPDALERREAIRREVTLLAAPDRLALRGDAASLELRAVAAVGPDDPEGLGLAARIAARLGDRIVAVSRRFHEPAGRPIAEAESRGTLEAAERLGDPPAVARADRLAAYRLLGSLPDLPDGSRQARALLEPLLSGRPGAQRQRLATLRAVLDRDATGEVASALGVHRNTVAYRVRRIEELTRWDLRDPELRLALALAVRIVQAAQNEAR